MELHHLFPMPGSVKKRKLLGRGIGSGKGKTCGRGTKGQKSRSGVSINGFEGGQMPIHRRLPKRGFSSINKQEYQLINLADIQYLADSGVIKKDSNITREFLLEIGLVNNLRTPIKLLADGELTIALTFNLDAYSSKAKELITAAGGQIA
ncbi:50S ribosomal protein L15 [Rickettsiales endosymbiont of Stachyamoeba lipophora]|uniref:50S ribosomal protein L15 n=1 Tax=Rickettsiales endosymbiont of Stachyamoeba lipophora TaxID=2486578 RepID=UPI000F652734|nr:50S ribosomal protein L15 [Rickettsiales endosymbiont of Stachyamoeba lipophora]AZL15883.1 50S ribosomal protein L15 [Rickettsiales endosymbiont of Stachyamoeba lipophora]